MYQNQDAMPAVADYQQFQASGMSKADESLLVKFDIRPRPDKEATEKEGRPIFKDTEYIDIRVPGSRDGVARPATDADRQRFSEHYRRFKERTENDQDIGTPLSEWAAITRSQAEELSFANVKTVEQLATMNDSQAARFMMGLGLKEKAKKWLEYTKSEKPIWEAEQKMKAMEGEVEQLKAALGNMVELLQNSPEDLNERQLETAKKRAVKVAQSMSK